MVSLHEILLHHLLFQVENETHTHKELTDRLQTFSAFRSIIFLSHSSQFHSLKSDHIHA